MSPSGHAAVDVLIARHYDELQLLARSRLRREHAADTLHIAGLVSEAYLRLARIADLDPGDKTRFFALRSATMRRVLVDHARRRRRHKRGAGIELVALEEVAAQPLTEQESEEKVALEHALARLEQVNPRGNDVVMHRAFGGRTLEETAALLGVSTRTVQRDWRVALAWLRQEVARDLDLAG